MSSDPSSSPLARVLLWLNCLSLDAPVVAVSWLAVVSQSLEWTVSGPEMLLLFLAVWLAYAGDRLLDAQQQKLGRSALPRHQFVARHPLGLTRLWLGIAAGTLWLAVWKVPLSQLKWASLMALLLGVYFAGCFVFPRSARSRIPREMVVGLVFTGAVFFFPLQGGGERTAGLAASVSAQAPSLAGVLFAGLAVLACLNCVGIACWEQQADAATGEVTLATRWPALKHYYPLLIVLALLFYGLSGWLFPRLKTPLVGMSLSVLCLGLLDRWPLPETLKPVLADGALLAVWGVSLWA